MKIGIGMAGKGQRRKAGRPCADPQFLVQFTDQRGFGGFALLDLTARKFPQARHRFAFGALRQQHPPICVNQRNSRDQNQLHDR